MSITYDEQMIYNLRDDIRQTIAELEKEFGDANPATVPIVVRLRKSLEDNVL